MNTRTGPGGLFPFGGSGVGPTGLVDSGIFGCGSVSTDESGRVGLGTSVSGAVTPKKHRENSVWEPLMLDFSDQILYQGLPHLELLYLDSQRHYLHRAWLVVGFSVV